MAIKTGHARRLKASATSTPTTLIIDSRSPKTSWNDGKISIAAVTIIAVIIVAALLFLAVWYIKRERRARARRLRELRNHSQDPFCPSSLTLNEDTSKALEQFLMKDVKPERTSLMFSRSRSPSITFVVDNADARNTSTRFYRNSYEGSSNSLGKTDTLTRVSTEPTGASLISSDMPQLTPSSSLQPPSNPSRPSMSSTVAPTVRSGQLCETTSASTGTTELSSVFSQEPTSSRTSTSGPRVANGPPPSSGSSMVVPRLSNSSRTSSQLSRSSPRHSGGRAHRLSQSIVLTPDAEPSAAGQSPQLPPIPATPSPLFRFSEG